MFPLQEHVPVAIAQHGTLRFFLRRLRADRLFQTLQHDVQHQRVQAQRRTKFKPDIREFGGEFLPELFQIADDMFAGGEEIREHPHEIRTELDAMATGRRNRGFRKFQVPEFNNGEPTTLANEFRQLHEVGIGRGSSTAMRHQECCRRHSGTCNGKRPRRTACSPCGRGWAGTARALK